MVKTFKIESTAGAVFGKAFEVAILLENTEEAKYAPEAFVKKR